MMRWSWCPNFTGQKVLIVASGPSAVTIPIEDAKGSAHFVAVNESWRLCPWAELLYGCDGSWWRKRNGVPEFGGIRISQDPTAQNRFSNVHHIKCRRGVDKLITDDSGDIGDGGNSTFQAINVVVRSGPPRLIGLVGADMRLDHGEHWHGRHEGGLNNPRASTIKRWIRVIDGVADELQGLGVAVLNLSPISALTRYRKASLQEFLSA